MKGSIYHTYPLYLYFAAGVHRISKNLGVTSKF